MAYREDQGALVFFAMDDEERETKEDELAGAARQRRADEGEFGEECDECFEL